MARVPERMGVFIGTSKFTAATLEGDMCMKMLLACLFVLSASFCSLAYCHNLVIETKSSQVSYELNGEQTSLWKLLDLAADLYKKEPQSTMAIIFDSSIPLDVVLNASGIFNKVGFQKVTLFARWKKSGKMCEITLETPVPFENPVPSKQ